MRWLIKTSGTQRFFPRWQILPPPSHALFAFYRFACVPSLPISPPRHFPSFLVLHTCGGSGFLAFPLELRRFLLLMKTIRVGTEPEPDDQRLPARALRSPALGRKQPVEWEGTLTGKSNCSHASSPSLYKKLYRIGDQYHMLLMACNKLHVDRECATPRPSSTSPFCWSPCWSHGRRQRQPPP